MSTTAETKPGSQLSWSRIVWAALLPLFVVTMLVFLRDARRGLDENELRRRIESSQVTWPDYEEDIKAIAASAAAEWQGTLTEVRHEGNTLDAVFRIEGPWAARKLALPILLREPGGGVYRNRKADYEPGCVRYTFELPESVEGAAPLMWVEIKYPHGQRRVTLSEAGQWSGEMR